MYVQAAWMLHPRNGYSQIPYSIIFADGMKHYREKFAPRMLRDSALSTPETHLKAHLEPDWNTAPVKHITIDSINEWAWKKRSEGLSWVTIKNMLRTMQRVPSCPTRNRTPPDCNRRWELAGMNPAVLRQQMGHSSSAMTARCTGEIPIEQVRAGFSMKFGKEIVVL